MVNKALFSSAKQDWETPQDFFDSINKHYEFTLDVCATPENKKCEKFFCPLLNGLEQSWKGEKCWMNPPYGREIGKWVKKAYEEWKYNDAKIVALLPARTDTRWFHDYIWFPGQNPMENKNIGIGFIKGRLRFVGAKHPAPFPSMLVYWL